MKKKNVIKQAMPTIKEMSGLNHLTDQEFETYQQALNIWATSEFPQKTTDTIILTPEKTV